MVQIIVPERGLIPECAQIYAAAYQADPWNEECCETDVENYLTAYLHSETKCCFAAVEDERIIGVALGLIVPSLTGPYLRIEDFCIHPSKQRNGCGTAFLNLIEQEAQKHGCDSVLLGTQRNFPSHYFYLKNGFAEIESVLLYKEIE